MARPEEWTLWNCKLNNIITTIIIMIHVQAKSIQYQSLYLYYLQHMHYFYSVYFSPGLSSGVAGERRAGLDCTDCTEGVGLTVEGSGCSMGDRYCLQ